MHVVTASCSHELRDFPDALLTPLPGTFAGFELEGKNARGNPRRKYDIEVPLAPFVLAPPDEPRRPRIIRTAIRIDEVWLDIRHASQLQDRVFQFPINPAEGYLEAWVCLHGRRNVIDVAEIAFGRLDAGVIAARMKLHVFFELEGSGFKNRDAVIEASLRLT